MLGIGPAVAQTGPTASITVSVTDPGGLPLSGAGVVLTGSTSLTGVSDAHGTFSFAHVAPGQYTLRVEKTSYQSVVRAEAVLTGSTLSETVVLAPISFSSLKVIGSVQAASRERSINTSTASVSDVGASTFLDQGSSQVTNVLNETPGIVTTVSAFPANGNSDGASMSAQQVPQIRGALPYETESLIDGHPVSVGANGYFTPLYVDPHFLQDVEIVKGPGAVPPDINYAVGGSVNYRTLDPTRTSRVALDINRDGYGGITTDIAATGTIHQRLGYVFGYGVNGSPGPINNVASYGIPGALIGANATINGQPICGAASPGSGCLLGVGAGPSNVYGSFKFLSPISLCCDPISTQYLARTELAKLRYSFSQQTALTVAYIGAQSTQSGDQTGIFDGLIFSPPVGYTGSIAANSQIPYGLDTYVPVRFDQTQGLLESELRTTFGKDSLLFRYYTGANDSDQHVLPFGSTYAFTADTWGALPIGPAGSNVYFNGEPERYAATGGNYFFPTQDHFSGTSGELDIPAAANLYTLSIDRTTHNSYAAQFFDAPGTNNVAIPQGSSQAFTTLLARAQFQLSPTVNATLGNYFIGYNTHYTPDGGATWQDASHSFYGPRLGTTWRPTNDTVVRASLGASLAPPYLALVTTQGGAPLPDNYGAPHFYTRVSNNGIIDPETSFGYDLGADHRFRGGLIVSSDIYLTSLHGQFFNQVVSDGTYTPPTGPNAGLTRPLYVSAARNLGTSRYEGIELTVHNSPVAGLGYRLQGSLERAYAYDLPSGFYDTGSGPNTTNLAVIPNVNFQPGGNGYNGISNGRIPYAMGYGELNYRARSMFYRLGLTYYGPNNSYNAPAFGVVSATARWNVTKSTSLQLAGYNLTNAYSSPFFNEFGGVPVPLVNGQLGPTGAINVGPPTVNITLHQELGPR